MSDTVLLRGGRIDGPAPRATAMLTDGSLVAWVGAEEAAPSADHVVDLDGAFVAPAFVDAHVHIFHSGMPIRSRRSTAWIENGDERNSRPRSRACCARPRQPSSENSIRFQ